MKKVAIFGSTGAGKSTLAIELAEITSLPLIILDKIIYQPGGEKNKHEEYVSSHSVILKKDEWIIDGYGCVPSAWERFEVADTLIYIDLPLYIHLAWVTKRFLKGIFVNPAGWPESSPIVKSTITSFKVLWLCHSKLTPRYRKYIAEASEKKVVVHLKSPHAIKEYLSEMRNEHNTQQ